MLKTRVSPSGLTKPFATSHIFSFAAKKMALPQKKLVLPQKKWQTIVTVSIVQNACTEIFVAKKHAWSYKSLCYLPQKFLWQKNPMWQTAVSMSIVQNVCTENFVAKKHDGLTNPFTTCHKNFCVKKNSCCKKCGKKPRHVLQTPMLQATKWFCHIRGWVGGGRGR